MDEKHYSYRSKCDLIDAYFFFNSPNVTDEVPGFTYPVPDITEKVRIATDTCWLLH